MDQNRPERPAVDHAAAGAYPGILVMVEVHDSVPSVAIVRPLGDLDMVTAPSLRSELFAQIERQEYVILDLDGVTFLSSGGLQVIVEAHHVAQDRGRALHVTGAAHRLVARPLRITGLDDMLVISDMAAAALAADLRGGESPRLSTAG